MPHYWMTTETLAWYPTWPRSKCTIVIDNIFSIDLSAGIETAAKHMVRLFIKEIENCILDNTKSLLRLVINPSNWSTTVNTKALLHRLATLGETQMWPQISLDKSQSEPILSTEGSGCHEDCFLQCMCMSGGAAGALGDRAGTPCQLWCVCVCVCVC